MAVTALHRIMGSTIVVEKKDLHSPGTMMLQLCSVCRSFRTVRNDNTLISVSHRPNRGDNAHFVFDLVSSSMS